MRRYGKRARRLTALAAMALALAPAVAMGAVRVDQDEVIFSLLAPEAKEVYLVGDFNQWNPTVEPMDRNGDRFEIGLFLVAGNYRYKFVVDGETIPDPDNLGRSPARGSPLSLVERSGGLILSTELPDEAAPAARAEFGARYIGRFLREDGDSDNAQRVDGFVSARLDHLRARGVVASRDSSWTWSPAGADAYFDRGFVEVNVGGLAVRGFENDTTWASSDPMRVVGDAGVFGYDAGFRRHGASASANVSRGSLRGFYADDTQRAPHPGEPPLAFGGFVSGTGADTSVYAYAPTFDGSDAGALEATLSMGDGAAGYTYRSERGVNPGRVAQVQRDGAVFETTYYATREDRNASSFWLAYDLGKSLRLTGAYGWGGMKARAFAQAGDTSAVPPPAFPGGGEAVEATFPLGETDRVTMLLETRGEGADASLRWDYTRFDFDGVMGASRAEVHRATLAGEGAWNAWSLSGSAQYTHAEYGGTPDALHIDWPEQNVWLSLWDDFDGERLAALSLDTYTVFRGGASLDAGRVQAGVDAGAVAEELVRALAQATARAQVEWSVRGPWRAQADGRAAWYDGDGWYNAVYIEAGYRSHRLDASIGFGFDPSAFDPVINDYASTARERQLRTALDGGFARSRAAAIASGVRANERAMEDMRAIKVEIIVRLP
jgi:hypothetical protein